MKHRLLVVDDEAGVRAALKQVLEFDGHEVRTANSGAQAVMLYPDVRPQVVFLDVKMAGLDGLETLRLLRERAKDFISSTFAIHWLVGWLYGASSSGISAETRTFSASMRASTRAGRRVPLA